MILPIDQEKAPYFSIRIDGAEPLQDITFGEAIYHDGRIAGVMYESNWVEPAGDWSIISIATFDNVKAPMLFCRGLWIEHCHSVTENGTTEYYYVRGHRSHAY